MTRAAAVFALLLLAACGPEASVEAPPQPVAPAAPVEAAPVEPLPEPEPEPEPIIVDFARIEGQTPADVLAYLGSPTLVRRDDNVQVMIFEADSCVLEVVFYEPDSGDYFRAEHYSARTRAGGDTDMEACARRLLEIAQATP